jgi:hypothetical protein
MMRKGLVGMLMLLLAGGLALAGTSGNWLHINVDEGGRNGQRVRVNIPLSLVEELLPLIKIDEFDRGRIRIDNLGIDDEFGDVDLQELWRAIQDVGDAEFVRVQTDDEDIRVVKEGDWLIIQTSEGSRSEVEVRFPLAVVDALFSGEPGELDLLAAVEALGRHGQGGDLVRVNDGDTKVRIWIDDINSED